MKTIKTKNGVVKILMTDIIQHELSMKTLKYFDRPSKEEREAQVYWGGALFNFGSVNVYDKSRETYQNLALISAVLSNNIYKYKERHLHRTLETLGVKADDKNIKIFSDISPLPLFAFAHTKVKIDDDEQTLIFIIIRGSDNSSEIIANIAGCFTLGSMHPREHIAHSAAKKFVMTKLTEYIDSIDGICPQNTKFLITGHSYGGAASNLVAKKLEETYLKNNIYCFTFGAPNNIIVAQSGLGAGSLKFIESTDGNIHNIRNTLDPICLISDVMPLDFETFTLYGKQHWFSNDARWFEHLPVLQLTSTSHHHWITNYINFVLSTMNTVSNPALPIRYNSLYAIGTAAVPKAILKLKKKLTERKKDK